MTTNPSIQKIFDQAFHPSLPRYSDEISRSLHFLLWGRAITDRSLAEEKLRDAAFDLIALEVSNRLQDERQEDESEECYAIRPRLFNEVSKPQQDISQQLRHLLPEFPKKEVESVYQEICKCLVIDAVAMGVPKFREFAILLNRYNKWTSYAAALNGHGISPSDEHEIYYWMGENDVELSSDYHEIGMNEGIAIVDRLIQLELNQDG